MKHSVKFSDLGDLGGKVVTIAQKLGKLETTFSDAFAAWYASFDSVGDFEAAYSVALKYLRERDRTAAYNRVKHYRGQFRKVEAVVACSDDAADTSPADAIAFVNENGGALQGKDVKRALKVANGEDPDATGQPNRPPSEKVEAVPAETPAADAAAAIVKIVKDLPHDVAVDALAMASARLEKLARAARKGATA